MEATPTLPKLEEDQKKLAEAIVQHWNQASPEEIGGAVPHFIVREAFKTPDHEEQRMKFTFVVTPFHMHADPALPLRGVEIAISVRQLLVKATLSEGGALKQGAAPKGQLERVAAKMLKDLQKQKRPVAVASWAKPPSLAFEACVP